jgi:hypothetical protein
MHYREIGRIITRYALLEDTMGKLLVCALRVGQKQGRQAVRSMPIPDQFEVIINLLELENIKRAKAAKVLGVTIKKHKKELDEVRKSRNQLVHRVWIDIPSAKDPVQQSFTNSLVEIDQRETGIWDETKTRLFGGPDRKSS